MLKNCKLFIFFAVFFLVLAAFCHAHQWHSPKIYQYRQNGASFWIFLPSDWKKIQASGKFKAVNPQIGAFLTVRVLSGFGKLKELASAYLDQESWIPIHKKIIEKNGKRIEEVIVHDLNHPSRLGIGIFFVKKGGLVVEESEISKDLYPLFADELWSLLRGVRTHPLVESSLSPLPSSALSKLSKIQTQKVPSKSKFFPPNTLFSRSAAVKAPPGERLYRDPKNRYEFFYPDSWKVQHLGENPLIYKPHGPSFEILSAGGMFKAPQKKILPMYEQSLAYAIKNLNVLNENTILIRGKKIRRLIYSFRLPDGRIMESWAVVISFSKTPYLFICTAPKNHFLSVRSTFTAILNSFQVIH